MKHRIITIDSDTCKEVLLTIAQTSDVEDVVEISAWHYHTEQQIFVYQQSTVKLPSFELSEMFIKDFSVESAEAFAKAYVLF